MVIPGYTRIHPYTFDAYTSVIRSFGWLRSGACIMMRALLDLERATPLGAAGNNDIDIVQYFIVNQNDDLFRHTLEFLVERVAVSD